MAVGGGTRNQTWMRIKATVSNCVLKILPLPEATLLGAALVAAIGAGIFRNAEEAIENLVFEDEIKEITPCAATQAQYRQIYEQGYVELQKPLRSYFQKAGED